MSIFGNLGTDDSIQDEVDSVGGSRIFDTDVYDFTIDMAYAGESKGGAQSVTLHLKTEDGRELRSTQWISSGNAKGNKNFYETKDGSKKYLPGFLILQSLSLLTVGKEPKELVGEDKVIKLYDYEQKKEVPTTVPVITELLGQQFKGGVFRQIVDKTQDDGQGNYVPTGETREENELNKIFRASDSMTTAEIRAQAESAEFIETWLSKHKGQVRDKSSKDVKPAKQSSTFGAAAGGTSAAPTKSLFGK